MSLFSTEEKQRIKDVVIIAKENVLITFRQKFGPTKMKEMWINLLDELGLQGNCVSWWSGAGSLGLLECEVPDQVNVYGQWVLDDNNQLLGVFEIEDSELLNIRSGYDAQSVTDSAMRAMRIGDSGGELE